MYDIVHEVLPGVRCTRYEGIYRIARRMPISVERTLAVRVVFPRVT